MILFFYFILSYLLGSISNAIIGLKLFFRLDIRDHGSGNAGATNVYRVLKKEVKSPDALLFTLIIGILDILKSFLPVFLFSFIFQDQYPQNMIAILKICSGICAILGHVYPVYFKFRGGKGVLTAGGAILALTPLASTIALLIGITIIITIRIVSVGSIIGAVSYPILVKFIFNYDSDYYFYFGLLCALFIIFTHRANIVRLLQGKEKKIF